jgi:hypothetical protein
MKKLFVAFLMVISLPVVASMVGASHRACAFVAIAGHTQVGGKPCDCGDVGCICDGDEKPPQGVVLAPSKPAKPGKSPAPGLLFKVVAILLILRLAVQ